MVAGRFTERSTKPASSVGADLNLEGSAPAGAATIVPRPARLSTRPRCCSVEKARVTVVRLIPSDLAILRCGGSLSPVASSPFAIRSAMASAVRRQHP